MIGWWMVDELAMIDEARIGSPFGISRGMNLHLKTF